MASTALLFVWLLNEIWPAGAGAPNDVRVPVKVYLPGETFVAVMATVGRFLPTPPTTLSPDWAEELVVLVRVPAKTAL